MIRTARFLRQRIPVALLSLAILLSIFQPLPRPAGASEKFVFPFYHTTGTYIFALDLNRIVDQWYSPGGTDWKPDTRAAKWLRINDNPATGFGTVVKDAKMSSAYVDVTSFILNKDTYIFGLHMGKGKSVGANIWRINRDATGFDLALYKGKMSDRYNHVVSFQLKGEPYILGLHEKVGANIWHIRDDGLTRDGKKKVAMDLVKYKSPMSPNYRFLTVFYREGHPYIFGLHKDVGANIWRVQDGGKGMDLVLKGAKFPDIYNHVLPFQLAGRPYLFGVLSVNHLKDNVDMLKELNLSMGGLVTTGLAADALVEIGGTGWVEWGKGYACIWEIGGSANSPTLKQISKRIPISHRYRDVTAFEQGGKSYLFGIHEEGFANIWRVNDNPADGFTLDNVGYRSYVW
ncbi:MAG: hypothetical protein CVU64_19915 [Deltaproteobacteria bacterium HGW-Deltaproteobacteria-21]|nr:MAG: hypothetical protein CVU64_19915 [Deltaproteobacteria bacterium HGW-Deltaproteobacteria-21]